MKTDNTRRSPLTSVLAMAATMRSMDCVAGAESLHDLHRHDPVVPVYQIAGDDCSVEAESALRVMEHIGDRLSRLRAAYGEWQEFEASAYFDLTLAQTRRLVRVSERASSVHVMFRTDLLLPSFRAAEHFWYYTYCPSYRQMTDALQTGHDPASPVRTFAQRVQPEMIEKWKRVCDVVRKAYALLQEKYAYLVAFLCAEERAKWFSRWNSPPASAIDPLLQSDMGALPTLTLSTEFPLPANRQPGRLRRLRNNRARRSQSRFLRRRWLDG